jgi:hypothetical protein
VKRTICIISAAFSSNNQKSKDQSEETRPKK